VVQRTVWADPQVGQLLLAVDRERRREADARAAGEAQRPGLPLAADELSRRRIRDSNPCRRRERAVS
jgi:hypothetical protein